MIQIGLCAYKRGTKMHYVFIELCQYSQWDCLNFQHYFLLPRSNTQRCVLPAHGWRREGLVVHVLSCEGVGDTTADRQNFSKTQATFRSFSAVSAPIFASKYTFCSIFQNLPDYLAEIFEIWQHFAIFSNLLRHFAKFC